MSLLSFAVKARFEYYGNKCKWCGSEQNLQIDHVIALALGGPNLACNIVPACRSCNLKKRSKPLEVWLKNIGQLT